MGELFNFKHVTAFDWSNTYVRTTWVTASYYIYTFTWMRFATIKMVNWHDLVVLQENYRKFRINSLTRCRPDDLSSNSIMS
ncbi:hypothetical protein BGW80DRAFT_1303502 [Lactifluus volemus]|nr:hypothetical protein BGW80DRAFT_1303502 [Lactifluus volemus]